MAGGTDSSGHPNRRVVRPDSGIGPMHGPEYPGEASAHVTTEQTGSAKAERLGHLGAQMAAAKARPGAHERLPSPGDEDFEAKRLLGHMFHWSTTAHSAHGVK